MIDHKNDEKITEISTPASFEEQVLPVEYWRNPTLTSIPLGIGESKEVVSWNAQSFPHLHFTASPGRGSGFALMRLTENLSLLGDVRYIDPRGDAYPLFSEESSEESSRHEDYPHFPLSREMWAEGLRTSPSVFCELALRFLEEAEQRQESTDADSARPIFLIISDWSSFAETMRNTLGEEAWLLTAKRVQELMSSTSGLAHVVVLELGAITGHSLPPAAHHAEVMFQDGDNLPAGRGRALLGEREYVFAVSDPHSLELLFRVAA